jgi:16S rRNA (cytosine967-C5)-methyltransferase
MRDARSRTVFEIAFEGDVGKFAPIRDGVVSVQDVVSASVAPFVDPKSGERIFDLCAGVGGKTMHLAELAPEAAIVAGDISEVRLATLRENAKRLGLTNVTTASLGLEGTRIPEGPFDRVLVDAPCSNSGVLMKRVEARDRLNEESIDEVVTLQETILKRAATCVKPGGVLVYATCSILREENLGTVDAFLLDHPGMFELVEDRTWWPHETGRDGGYVARLVRKS